jgi:hypothetical protein
VENDAEEQLFDQKDLNLVDIPEEGLEIGEDEDGASKITKTSEANKTPTAPKQETNNSLVKPDKIKVAQTINADIELPGDFLYIDAKDILEKGAQGNVLAN